MHTRTPPFKHTRAHRLSRQMYKYACAARPGGPAIDLMGPWWQPSGWELYWLDMNLPGECSRLSIYPDDPQGLSLCSVRQLSLHYL